MAPIVKVIFKINRFFFSVFRRIGRYLATYKWRNLAARVGAGTVFQHGVRFTDPTIVYIGDDCYFWKGVGCSADFPGGILEISDRVQINRDVHIDTTGGIAIHSDVLISEEVVIFTHDHGIDPHSKPVGISKVIECGAWIGMRSVIMPSCRRIGKNAIVGAGSIVTKDIPDNVIVAGNPARVVRVRDDIVNVD